MSAAIEGLKKWLARSRELNPQCGCDKRGERMFSCAYHEGVEDAWDDAYSLGQTFCTAHTQVYERVQVLEQRIVELEDKKVLDTKENPTAQTHVAPCEYRPKI